ncbi:protein NRT1/ PTR FAMILY 7.3 isoform X2 [Ziziphus jujuba]|uniref:Protein NRT1/ PTR FAMILY 7.3 isoform X2 n=1 Tax=Ziziphus jujuba TaxID=326968 RepID=A0A6P6FP67_ZIZJJ|nr:protein NRT1/ PTR FAMILY 7.3 isoform X2 [Ziziphus jujuba]
MACLNVCKEQGHETEEKTQKKQHICTLDGTVDWNAHPAIRGTTGSWVAGILILVNQGLATLAFLGVEVNLVLFLTRVLGQDNAEALNNVSKWTGTVYIFSLLGAFLSDSYWGRFKTCAIFQLIFVLGLASLPLCAYLFLLKPRGCGDKETPCGGHSGFHEPFFYISIYLIALGNGDTILGYFEDEGMWTLGFWASAGSALLALVLFLCGTPRYRHFKPSGNPLSRFCQVIISASRKWRVEIMPAVEDNLYEEAGEESSKNGARKMLHTEGFKFLDRAAYITEKELYHLEKDDGVRNPWRLCTVTQVEEVKCILRLLPIWLCTILYSVVFNQMASLFVEQGAAMKTNVASFHIPPASMSSFDILSVAAFIFIYRRVLDPLFARLKNNSNPKGLTELQRMGIGLVLAILAMVSAGVVECFRLKYARKDCRSNCESPSSLSIFWQVPQYMLIGASEVFMYVGQIEFFNGQAPDGLKSFGSALCMTSISLGNYVSSLLVTIVMKFSTRDDMPGWIPGNLNKGHLDRFYFLLAALTTADLLVYFLCAKWYKYTTFEGRNEEDTNNNIANRHAELQV